VISAISLKVLDKNKKYQSFMLLNHGAINEQITNGADTL